MTSEDTYDRTLVNNYLAGRRQGLAIMERAIKRGFIPPFDPLIHSTPARTWQRTVKFRVAAKAAIRGD